MIELEAEGDRRVVVVAIGAHRDPCAIRHLLDYDDVAQRLLGAILLAIAGAEGSAPSFQQLVGIADGAVAGFDRGFELVSPGVAGGGDLCLPLFEGGTGAIATRQPDYELDRKSVAWGKMVSVRVG